MQWGNMMSDRWRKWNSYQTANATQCVIGIINGVSQLVNSIVSFAVSIETHAHRWTVKKKQIKPEQWFVLQIQFHINKILSCCFKLLIEGLKFLKVKCVFFSFFFWTTLKGSWGIKSSLILWDKWFCCSFIKSSSSVQKRPFNWTKLQKHLVLNVQNLLASYRKH